MNVSRYTCQKIEEIFAELSVSVKGLSEEEIIVRRKKFGLNQLAEQKVYWYNILLRQFKSSFMYLLLGVAVLYFLIGQIIDGSMVLLFVFLNKVVGFYQEYQSENSIKLLKKYVAHKTRVIRNGKEEVIDSKFLVPGDIVVVEAGDMICLLYTSDAADDLLCVDL